MLQANSSPIEDTYVQTCTHTYSVNSTPLHTHAHAPTMYLEAFIWRTWIFRAFSPCTLLIYTFAVVARFKACRTIAAVGSWNAASVWTFFFWECITDAAHAGRDTTSIGAQLPNVITRWKIKHVSYCQQSGYKWNSTSILHVWEHSPRERLQNVQERTYRARGNVLTERAGAQCQKQERT